MRNYQTELSTRRPALWKLTGDKQEIRGELLDGFSSREEVLLWTQKVCVRTLGEMPDDFIEVFAREFQPRDVDPTLLAALLKPYARDSDMSEDAAQELRRLLDTEYIEPASVRAFERLREGASEYFGDEDGDKDYDPAKQRYIAMRPAIDDLESVQQECLRRLLSGLDDKDDMLDWFDTLQLATHGEVGDGLLKRMYHEEETQRLLCGDAEGKDKRARELFAAYYLLPLFNDGIRDLSGRANEQVDGETGEITPTQA